MSPKTATVGDGRTTRWVGHRDRRRAEFVRAAVGVIDSEGPAASVEQIAAAAGVTRQVLYRQFEGRPDLDAAIVEHAASLVYQRVILDIGEVEDVELVCRRVLEGYLDFIEEHRSLYWFTRVRDGESAEVGAVGKVKDKLAVVAVAIAEALTEERGSVPRVPLDAVFAAGLIGLVDASVSHWLKQPGATSREQLVDGLVLALTAAIDAAIPPA